jgi:hypothetical protein
MKGQTQNLMTAGHSVEFLKNNILEPSGWVPYPKDAAKWKEVIPDEMFTKQIALAEKYLDYDWPVLKASAFMEFVQNGNRSHFERMSFGRRQALAALVLGESLENKGRFLNDILNGIWAICEETYWGVPAHLFNSKSGLPDINEPAVLDLFAAETGMLLAWTDFLLGDKLDEISPAIRERIYYEVNNKIFDPVMNQVFGWMGINSTKENRPNNWNPWIISNVMVAGLLLEKDKGQRAELILRSLGILDNFLNPYPEDGGCDEGPGYWSRAGASVYECLETISMATNNKIDLFDEPLIVNMGTYIYKTYIGNGYFLNFADAAAKTSPPFMVLYRYGKAIGSTEMMSMAADFAKKNNFTSNPVRGSFGCLARDIPWLYYAKELSSYSPSSYLVRDFWFPEIQIMGARDSKTTLNGLYFAAKGGNNAESHNHNDVGNFIVFVDGEPAIIDIGVETYTKKTFSNQRYSIWTMQSAFHNLLPLINQVMQNVGISYKAKNPDYKMDDKKVRFNLDIASAYPDDAEVKSWNKEFVFSRGKSLIIYENFSLIKNETPVITYLMVCRKPVITSQSYILLPSYNKTDRQLKIKYDSKKFDMKVENYPITDRWLKSSWTKGELYRLVFSMKNQALSGKIKWEISVVE